MKTIKRVLSISMIMAMTISLCACGKAKLQGSWQTGEDADTQYTFTFNDDGSGTMSCYGLNEFSINYSTTDESKITIEYTILGQVQTEEFTYELDKKTLKLTRNGSTITLEKK